MPSHYEDEEEQKALKGSEVANAIEQGAGEFFSNSLRQLQKVRDSETIAGEVVKAGQWLVEGSMENVKASDDPWNLKDEYGSSNPFVNFAQVSTGSTLKGAGHVLRMANAPFWALGKGLGGISEHALGVDPRFGQWTGEIGGDLLLAPKLYASLARRGVALKNLPGLFNVGTGINKNPVDPENLNRLRKIALNKKIKADSPIEDVLNPERLTRIKTLKQDLLRQVVGDIPTDPVTGTALKVRRYVSREQANKVRYRMGQISPDMKGGKFIYNSYESAKGPWTPKYRRMVIEDFLTPGFYKRGFSGTAATLTGEFRSRYAQFLSSAGIPPGDVQLHHIMALADGIPLYDGLIYNSKEWWDLTEFLLKRAIRPGAWEFGGKMNYKVVIGQAKQKTGSTRSAHGVTHLFYDHKLRPEGGKNFWRKSELKKMNDDPRYRYKKAEKFARIVKRSEVITDQAMDTYELLNPGTVWTEELTETFLDKLGKLDERGLLPERIMKEEYQIPKMQELVQKISDELDVIGPAGKMSDDQFLDMLNSFDGESIQLLRELFGGEVKINTGIKVNLRDPLVQRGIIRRIRKGNPDINPGQINIITNKIKKKFPPKKK